ncbi:MAG: CotH kinase family protein, partial [Kiritimatiellae bacterium]|nr:CotH kinase family protein [Kiritimatiellia bacterium]
MRSLCSTPRWGALHFPLLLAVPFLVLWPAVGLRAEMLVSRGTTWRYVKGTAEASDPASDWRALDYTDTTWAKGVAPFGYGLSGLGTTFSDMKDGYSTFFIRKTFTVSSMDDETRLRALVDYDDGWILWINGERVFEKNEPDGEPLHDSLASESHESGTFESFEAADPDNYLEVGENVVAVQAFNSSRSSSDCKLDVELSTFKRVADTTFSHDRGFYDASFTVTISTATPGATIRYTTNGTAPSASYGTVGGTNAATVQISTTTCLRAAAFKSGYDPTDVDTQTYIFLDDVIEQTKPAGYPDTFGTNLVVADYNMDQSVVDAPAYSGIIKGAMKSIPTISVVGNLADIFGTYGVYGNGAGRGIDANDLEVPVSAELFYPAEYSGAHEGGFQIDCGMKGHSHVGSKRSFKLYFRGEYGATKLRYPLFETAVHHADSAVDRFDKLVMRAGGNDKVSNSDELPAVTYTRDQWGRDTLLSMGQLGSHGMYCHMYINGLYWGLYNPVERPDHTLSAAYLGGDKDEWFAVDRDYEWSTSLGTVVNGDPARWKYLHSTLRKRDLTLQANYEEVKEYLDLVNYCDDLIAHWYSGTGDWPGNNWYATHRMDPPTPARYFGWDMESSWIDSGEWGDKYRSHDVAWVHPAFFTNAASHYPRDNPQLFRKLELNKNFKTLLADRVYRHCENGGPLTESNAKARHLALCDKIEDAMVGESARWGDLNAAYTYTRDEHWYSARSYITNKMTGNLSIFYSALRDHALYPSLNPPVFQQHGGAVATGFRLTMSNPNASTVIYYTTDGSDPRLPYGTGQISSAAVQYAGALSLTKTTHVKARVYKSVSTWSAVHEATYNFTAHYSKLRITELMYNPLGGSDFEFVELKNTGTSARGLSEMTFKGIGYTFPPGAELEAGQTLLLVNNAAAFTNRY